MAPRTRRVLLVASPGGHLAQLQLLAPAFAHDERTWVTFEHAGLDVGDDNVVFCHGPTTRHVGNLLRNLRLAHRVLREFRPDLIVSTGAGAAVPFFALARTVGARAAFVEVYDRIDSRTLTGRLVKQFADAMLLQWPEQRDLYGTGSVIGPVYDLRENRELDRRSEPGQRVFVTVGTDHHPFERLVRWTNELATTRPELDVFLQRGTATSETAVNGSELIDFEALQHRLRWADAVVCHGGPSTILEAVAAGHRPVVVARSSERGEHVDDHQQRFARHLGSRGAIDLVDDQAEFNTAVERTLRTERGPASAVAAPTETLAAFASAVDDLVPVLP